MSNIFLDALKETDNYTFTENGAGALKSTNDAVLDAFGSLGAMKNSPVETILDTFYKAFYADRKLAMRLLFYIRDIRGGQGMRRVFRVIARSLAITHPECIKENLDNFLFFGRGDDLLCLFDTPCEKDMIEYCRSVLYEDFKSLRDGGSCSLLAKWMPSENTSSAETRILASRFVKAFGTTSKQYRKMLSALRKEIGIVESKMSANEWDQIDFSKLPSRAAMVYSDAFMKHTFETYSEYLNQVAEGDAKINAGALFPVDIVHKVVNSYRPTLKDKLLCDALWKALPNYFEGLTEKGLTEKGLTEKGLTETGLCVVDVSGSMCGEPLEVALSLGLYCADKARGPFKDHFITFSAWPTLQRINGRDIFDKIQCMNASGWGMNTDLEAVFDIILTTAIDHNLKQEDMPAKLYIISDMQFDEARGTHRYSGKRINPFMAKMKDKFAEAGYIMPAIVYWNVRACNNGMFQETFEGENCCMVSGYSPSLFKAVIEGTEYTEEINEDGDVVIKETLDPITVMLTALNNERYDRVAA